MMPRPAAARVVCYQLLAAMLLAHGSTSMRQNQHFSGRFFHSCFGWFLGRFSPWVFSEEEMHNMKLAKNDLKRSN